MSFVKFILNGWQRKIVASLTQPHGTCGFCVYSIQVIKTMAFGATLAKKIILSLLSQHL